MKLSNTEKWWRNAVLWEFCELDQTHDKYDSRFDF